MDGLKLPVILLIIVLALGIFLFNPFANKKGYAPTKNSANEIKKIPKDKKPDLKNAAQEFEKKNFSAVIEQIESESDSNNYEQQKLLGYSYSAIKDFDKAILAFENCLAIRKVPEIGYSLAYIYETTGRIKVARQLYEDVLKANLPPKMKKAVYEGLARTSGFENDPKTAFKYAKELARLYPESPQGFISLVKILKDTGKTRGLEKLTDVADKFHSGNFEYNFWVGVLLFETGDFKESLARFRKCIQIMPDNSTPYFYTYKILKRMKNTEQALAELEKYHKLNPLLPHIFFEAAIDAKEDGKIDLAYKFIRSALTMDRTLLGRDDKGTLRQIEKDMANNPNKIEKKFFQSFINYVNGEYKSAREEVEQMLTALKGTILETDAKRIIRECRMLENMDQAYSEYMSMLAMDRERDRQIRIAATKQEAEPESEKTLTLAGKLKKRALMNPNDLKLQYQAGLELAKEGEVEDAKNFLKNALRLNPNILEVNFSLAKIFLFEENFIESRRYLDQALRINPNSSQALSLSAGVYLKNNDFLRAESEANSALRSNPNNGEARLILAKVFARNHDFRSAVQQINLGLEIERDSGRRQQLLSLKDSIRN